MHLYILFAHPSKESFCREVLRCVVRGLEDAGHTSEVCDLYQAGFLSEMDCVQYAREVGGDPQAALPDDVSEEHEKLARSDAVVSI